MFRGGEGGISQGGGKGVASEWDQTKRVSKGRERVSVQESCRLPIAQGRSVDDL